MLNEKGDFVIALFRISFLGFKLSVARIAMVGFNGFLARTLSVGFKVLMARIVFVGFNYLVAHYLLYHKSQILSSNGGENCKQLRVGKLVRKMVVGP